MTEALAATLERDEEHDPARAALRGFLDKIVILPGYGSLQVVRNLGDVDGSQQMERLNAGCCPIWLVAGACNQRYLQLWSGAA
jgi:hypothetical protein